MTWILTNDDGIDAPGIRALQQALKEKVVLVAPQQEWSGCGHRVTTTHPIQIQRPAPQEFAIAGTPADCVRVAMSYLFPKDISLVIAGINAGGNLGADMYISGTVAAVREAALHRIPAIALSHYRKGKRPYDWPRAAHWSVHVITDLLTRPLPATSFWNVNLPHLESDDPEPEVVFCPPCRQPLPLCYRVEEGEALTYIGDYSQRRRDPGTDVDVCFSGSIAVSQIDL